MPPKPKTASNKKRGANKRTSSKPHKDDAMEDNTNALNGIEATQNSDISGKLDRMMNIMDVLAKKVLVLELNNIPGTATAALLRPYPSHHQQQQPVPAHLIQ